MNRIDKCVETIKKAYLSQVPVVWLVTNDKEEAIRVAKSFAEEHLGGMFGEIGKEYKYSTITAFSLETDGLSKKSKIFFDWLGSRLDENATSGINDIRSFLESFVNLYLKLQTEAEVRQNEELQERAAHSMAIIASPYLPRLSWLNRYIETIHIPLPDDSEIKNLLELFFDGNFSINEDIRRKLAVNFKGFSEREIKQVLYCCQHSEYFDNFDNNKYELVLAEIQQKKKSKLEGFPGLKWVATGVDDSITPAGLEVVSRWLQDRKELFEDPETSIRMGYDIPKGFLITGLPGSGKSLIAKEAARALGLPLISMDLGDIQEGIVGKSEEHMANALRMVDAMAPCVLWVDEIEKAFAGAESGHSDGGVMRRMFGKFLTWMQEKKSYCFVAATSNDVTNLPPELFRSERFDERFFCFMPTVEECADIIMANLESQNERFEKTSGRVFYDGALLDKGYWIDILNNNVLQPAKEEVVLDEDGSWRNGIRPQTKLFTGADISAFVKQLKFRILNDRADNHHLRYGQKGAITKAEVNETIDKVLKDFMPYGQTNLTDIAKCFVTLTKKRFKVASSHTNAVIRFEDYDETKHTIKYDHNRLRASDKSNSNRYNRTLYRSIVGAINSQEKMKNRNPERPEKPMTL